MSARLLMIAALLVPLAACGGSGSNAESTVRHAVNGTVSAGSVREAASSQTPTASGSSHSSAEGTYSFTSHLGAFRVKTDAILGTFDVVLSGSTLYLHLPPALVIAARGKTWASADLANPPAVPGSGNLTSLAGAADPSRLFAGLLEGLTSATRVGNATVDGTMTVQYNAKVSFPKARSALAASEATLVGGSTASDDLYIQPSTNRVVRLVSRVDLKGGAVETLTVDFTSFGAPVTAQPPPAGDVVPGSQLLGQ